MRTGFVRSVWLAAFVVCGVVDTARAEPDMRDIPPLVMIVADTSGSMEWLPGCTCDTDCEKCYPDCNAADVSARKNRWALLLEALTGSFTNFQCVPLPRTDSSQFTYDFGYPKPFHRPWLCPGGATYCPYPGTTTTPIQVANGLLDNYASRIRFGLATFDGMRTYAGTSDLVTSFDTTRSRGADGMYSYADDKRVRYPTCEQTHLINSGIRDPSAPEGGLISLNTLVGSCTTAPCDPQVVNAAIQDSLLKTRTFGGTPTGSALDDLYYHFKKDLNDPMTSCRDRYGILITDGYPDDDFRDYPDPGCDCKARGNCPTKDDPDLMECPYPTASQAAFDLVTGRTTKVGETDVKEDPQLKKLYVVGMSIADSKKADLDLIALKGGSGKAFFADDPSTLTATLDGMLAAVTRPISRSVPAFATGVTGGQYQVNAGFGISTATPPVGFTPPWKGILERRRFVCDNTGALSSPDLAPEDKFGDLLNQQSTSKRKLWTALPSNPDTTKDKGLLNKEEGSCGALGCAQPELKDLTAALFGPTVDNARKDTVVKWMYGDTGSVREKLKLGDIYHSSPAIVGPPVDDPGDQSYTLFRESKLINDRPSMLYVNSNDGILHAFLLEDHKIGNNDLQAGFELWGFVPPILLASLDSQLSAHRLNLDGTPVVKDVYFSKGTAPTETDYKTVLVTGMRAGGSAYVALDVTDPQNPKFLWQFTDTDMGATYGLPEIVQARYSLSPSQPASLRAMAILPGGKGEADKTVSGCDATYGTWPSMRIGSSSYYGTYTSADLAARQFQHRTAVPCYKRQGRSLYFVDVETGILIKKIADTTSSGVVFRSPVVGSPTAYQDSVGSVATEGFVLDQDGVLWRIDLSSSDPRPTDPLNGWTVRPFHDLFFDIKSPDEVGETTYERPILSLDDKHQLVVIVGTGDTDNFEKLTAMNRVVSLTELVKSQNPSSPADYVAGLNWEMRVNDNDDDGAKGFVQTELVTGSMALIAQQLYFASFISKPDPKDPCAFGRGRLWSVHYTHRDDKMANSSGATATSGGDKTFAPLRVQVVSSDTTVSATMQKDAGMFNILKSAAEPNLLVLGLGATQRATCEDLRESDLASYFSKNVALYDAIKQTKKPAIWIVAQASSDNANRVRANSALGTLEVKLDRPMEFSQVSSWAGSIE